MFCDGSRRGVGLDIVCGVVRDRWRSASVAWWLVSRGQWCSEGYFLGDFQYVGWDRSIFYRYVSILNRGGFAKFKFQVGLEVGIR